MTMAAECLSRSHRARQVRRRGPRSAAVPAESGGVEIARRDDRRRSRASRGTRRAWRPGAHRVRRRPAAGAVAAEGERRTVRHRDAASSPAVAGRRAMVAQCSGADRGNGRSRRHALTKLADDQSPCGRRAAPRPSAMKSKVCQSIVRRHARQQDVHGAFAARAEPEQLVGAAAQVVADDARLARGRHAARMFAQVTFETAAGQQPGVFAIGGDQHLRAGFRIGGTAGADHRAEHQSFGWTRGRARTGRVGDGSSCRERKYMPERGPVRLRVRGCNQ